MEEEHNDLHQNTPFPGVLDDDERLPVMNAYAAEATLRSVSKQTT